MKKFIHQTTLMATLCGLSFFAYAQNMTPPVGSPEYHKNRVQAALKECAQSTKMKEDSPEFSKCMMGKGFMKPSSATTVPSAGMPPGLGSSPQIAPGEAIPGSGMRDGKPLMTAPLSVTSNLQQAPSVAPGAKPDK